MIFSNFKTVVIFFHGILMMATFVVSYSFFATKAGDPLDFAVPEFINMLVVIGVLGISAVSALVHIVGGGIMGATAGGFLTGIKAGFLLGLAYAVGRLWLYAASACVAAVLFWDIFRGYAIALGIVTVVCFMIQQTTTFVWTKLQSQ